MKQSHKNILVCVVILVFFTLFFQDSRLPAEFFPTFLCFSCFRDSMTSKVSFLFPGVSSDLLLGILIGMDEGIPWNVREDFRRVGLSHIFAISGYNVSLVIDAVFWILIWVGFWRRQAFWASIFFVIFFTFFVGASPSVVRASIMALIFLFSREVERIVSPVLLLTYTAVLMVLFSPKIFYDIGFQLSFAATAGLFFLQPKLFSLIPSKIPKWVRKNISESFSAFLFVSPIIYFHFRSFSWIGPFANLIVLPFIPIIMLFGFISVVFSYVFLPLGKIFAAPTWILLEAIQKFIKIL